MLIPQVLQFISPAELIPGTTLLAGTTKKIVLDRTWPLEAILIFCDLTVDASIGGTLTADGMMGFLKTVNLTINDGVQPRTIVDASGVGLLEYASQTGINLDSATLALISEHTKASPAVVASNVYRIAYFIPLVHPQITEPRRTQMLCDINNHPQDPVLTLTFSTTAEMQTTAQDLATASCEVVLVRRRMTAGLNKSILDGGGYVPFDILESVYSIATGVTAEQRLALPIPGSYAGLMMRMYKGANPIVRGDISGNVTAGTETRWRLESGSVVLREWRTKHIKTINEMSRPLNSDNLTYAPNIGPVLASNTRYQDPGSFYLDFLSDAFGDDGNELGSLLDCNLPAASGLKMEVVFTPSSASTNAHALKVLGHRYFGDLARYKAFKG